MAGSLVATVTGYLAQDPARKANGKAVGFSIPVSKGRDEPTTWIRITAWGKTADFVEQYLKKGALVTASGEIEMREYESAKGKGVSLELNASHVKSFKTDAAPAAAAAPKHSAPSDDDMPF
jgi:single-stranded DNA-binding protein